MNPNFENILAEKESRIESKGATLANEFGTIVDRATEMLRTMEGRQIDAHDELLAQDRGQATQELSSLLVRIQELAAKGKANADLLAELSVRMESIKSATQLNPERQ